MGSGKSRKEKEEIICKFTLMDDVFFEAFAQNKPAVQEMLRVILEDPKLTVVELTTQYTIPNLYGRSVRLDAFCRLGDGRIVNVEIQNSNNDDQLKRANLNGSQIIVRESEKSTKFEDLPHVVVVFIMKFDPFGLGKVVYHTDLTLREDGRKLESNTEYIFVNATAYDGTKLARLMRLMQKKEIDDQDEREFPEITRQFKHLKYEKKGVQQMCDLMEKYMAESKEESREEGRKEGRIEVFLNAIKHGTSLERLPLLGATEEEIKQCEKMLNRNA